MLKWRRKLVSYNSFMLSLFLRFRVEVFFVSFSLPCRTSASQYLQPLHGSHPHLPDGKDIETSTAKTNTFLKMNKLHKSNMRVRKAKRSKQTGNRQGAKAKSDKSTKNKKNKAERSENNGRNSKQMISRGVHFATYTSFSDITPDRISPSIDRIISFYPTPARIFFRHKCNLLRIAVIGLLPRTPFSVDQTAAFLKFIPTTACGRLLI